MTKRVAGTDVTGHPAVRAWARLRPGAPARVVRLQNKAKGGVYRLEGAGPGGSAIIAKHSSPERIHRERAVYEQVLPALPVLTVRCHGFVEDPDGQGCWLFLEDAGGEEYSPSSALDRALAGRWLGLLPASGTRLAAGSRQPDLGPHHYLDHLHSAHATLLLHLTNPALTGGDVGVLREVVRQCEVIAAHWGDVQRVCAGLPRTFVHGDFAPKNVRVRVGTGVLTLVPFDWGSAGWGVPAADLVQAGSAPDHGTDWGYWASPDL